jgi:outer membrane receptor protein involved in Fe transport
MPGAPQDPGALLDTKRLDLSLGRDQSFGLIHWGWDVSWTSQRKHYDSRATGPASGIGHQDVLTSAYFAERLALSLHADMTAGERHFLELLAEFSDDKLDVSGDSLKYLDYIDNYDMKGWDVTLQDTIALDRAGTFLLTPSLRYHKLDGEDKVSWQMALSKEFSPNLMIKSAFGTYSRAPNMYELYGDGAFLLEAKGGLKWETGTQFDVGVIWNDELRFVKFMPGLRGRFSLSGFMRDSDNLIELMMMSKEFARYENIALAEVKGVEFEGSLDWRKWGLSLSATWMEGLNKSSDSGAIRYNGMALPNRPKLSGTLRVSRAFNWGSAFAEYQYVGSNYADMAETVLFDKRDLINLGVKYNFSPTTRLSVGVNDLFNDAEGWQLRPNGYNGPSRMLWYPIEGRSFYATLDMEF